MHLRTTWLLFTLPLLACVEHEPGPSRLPLDGSVKTEIEIWLLDKDGIPVEKLMSGGGTLEASVGFGFTIPEPGKRKRVVVTIKLSQHQDGHLVVHSSMVDKKTKKVLSENEFPVRLFLLECWR